MRRIILFLTTTALMVSLLVSTALPAMARGVEDDFQIDFLGCIDPEAGLCVNGPGSEDFVFPEEGFATQQGSDERGFIVEKGSR